MHMSAKDSVGLRCFMRKIDLHGRLLGAVGVLGHLAIKSIRSEGDGRGCAAVTRGDGESAHGGEGRGEEEKSAGQAGHCDCSGMLKESREGLLSWIEDEDMKLLVRWTGYGRGRCWIFIQLSSSYISLPLVFLAGNADIRLARGAQLQAKM